MNNRDRGFGSFATVNLSPVNPWINASPQVSQVPIQEVLVGQANTWTIGAADPDLDPMSFSTGTAADMCGGWSGCTGGPSGWTLNANSGVASFTPPSSTSGLLYSVMVKVSDGYSQVTLDFLMLNIVPLNICKNCDAGSASRCNVCGACTSPCTCSLNANPAFYHVTGSPFLSPDLGGTVCFLVGQQGTFLLGAEDTVDTTCDEVEIFAGSLPQGVLQPNGPPVPELHLNVNGFWRRQYIFKWTPSANQIGTHLVSFYVADKFNGRSTYESISLLVPTAQESALPTVTSYTPTSADENTSPILVFSGSGFNRGTGLFCRFKLGNEPFKYSRAVWQNGNSILCAMPNKAALSDGTPSTSNSVQVDVSNAAFCDVWRRVLPNFSFFPSCPPGTAGPTCSQCPAGKYQTSGNQGTGGTQCLPCLAGRFGNQAGLTTPLCSGPCANGHYCPPGTVNSNQNNCPAGRYGDRAGLEDAGCSGLCQAGFYCVPGSSNARQGSCPPGRFGGTGEGSASCEGPCQAGYYCTGSSPSSVQNECGGSRFFCQSGSSVPTAASPGDYTSGGSSPNTRTDATTCEPGFFCDQGVRTACPAGRYQSTPAAQTNLCEGPCRAGFFCPLQSTSDTASPCGAGRSKPATVYCPTGSGAPTPLNPATEYSLPEDAPPDQRTGKATCTAAEFCVDGFRRPRTEWTRICMGGGATVASTYSVEENMLVSNFRVDVKSNEGSPSITVTGVQFTAPTGCQDASRWQSSPAGAGASTSVTLSTVSGYRPNHETCDHFMAAITAETGEGFVTTCSLRIEVEDKNDCPVWNVAGMQADANYPVLLMENPRLGTGLSLQLVNAGYVTDEDEGAELDFSVVSTTPNTVTAGAPDGLFGIGRCSGQLFVNTTVPSDVDFEFGERSWTVRVRVNDTAAVNPCSIEEEIVVNVVNINEAPTFNPPVQTFTIAENSAVGALTTPRKPVAADVDASYNPIPPGSPNTPDPTWLQLSYSLVAQSEALFNVDPSTGDISVRSAGLNFEALGTPSVTLSVQVRDSASPALSQTRDFVVTVQDVNDAPVVPDAAMSIAENSGTGTVVGQIIAQDDEFTFMTNTAPLTWTVSVAAFGDGSCGTSHPNPFSIRPTTTGGPSAGVTADLVVSGALDFETLALYTLTVTATDSGHNGDPALAGSGTVVVNVTNVNEPPVVSGAPTSVAVPENEPPQTPFGAALGAFVTDPDVGPGCVSATPVQEPMLYTVVSGSRGEITVDSSTGQLLTNAQLNFEAAWGNVYSLVVGVQDNANTVTFPMRVNVTNVNEPPVFTAGQQAWIEEDALAGVTAGTSASTLGTAFVLSATDPDFDDDASTLTYSIAAGSLVQVTGRNVVTAPSTVGGVNNWPTATFDFESTPQIPLAITVTDRHGASGSSGMTLMLTNVPEPPLMNNSLVGLEENTDPTVVVMTLSALDSDIGDTHTYSIVGVDASSTYTQCAALLGISNVDQLVSIARSPDSTPLNPEVCVLNVRATDSSGLDSPVVQITVTITDGNTAPVLPSGAFTVLETARVGSIVVDDLGGSDANTDQTVSYIIAQAVDNNGAEAKTRFAMVNGADCMPSPQCPGRIRLLGSLDFETATTYTLTVQMSDSFSPPATSSAIITINVGDVNEPPRPQGAGSFFLFPENSNSGDGTSPLFQASALDDEGNTLTWSAPSLASTVYAVSSPGNMGTLTLSESDASVLAAAIDYETHLNPLGFNFSVFDGVSTRTVEYAVQIVDVNEAPSATFSPTALTLREGANRVGDVLVQIFGTDPDLYNEAWRTLVYTLAVPDPDEIFEAFTNIGAQQGELRLKSPVDFEKGSSYSMQVLVSDGGVPSLTHTVTIPIQVLNVNDIKIDSIGGPWFNMSTAGGQTLQVWGSNLGHFHDNSAIVTLEGQATVSRSDQPTTTLALSFPCVQVTDYSYIECTTQPGVGVGLAWKLQVQHPNGGPTDVAPVTINNGKQVVGAYGAPRITGITGAHTGMSTAGGDSIVLTGDNLPPSGLFPGGFAYWQVSYGPSARAYTASNSASAPDGTSATVLSAEGVGSGLSWSINVGGQQSTGFLPPPTGSSYSTPSITGVRLAAQRVPPVAGAEANTVMDGAGGDTVVLTGTNFGTAASLATDNGFRVFYYRLRASVGGNGSTTVVPAQFLGGIGSGISAGPTALPTQYNGNLESNHRYTAAACAVTVAHTQMTCTTVPGAGDGLLFRATIGGQTTPTVVGSAVTLHYHPPVIAVVGGDNAFNSPTEGNGAIDLRGRHLGATGDQRIVATYGPAGNVGKFTASTCVSQSPTTVRCYTAPGTGRDFSWTLAVADQNGTPSPFDAGTRYAEPVVAVYAGDGARDANTPGGQTVLLQGRNFGPLGSQNIEMVRYFNGRDMVAFREAVATGNTAAFAPPVFTVTSACTVSTAHVEISCVLVQGAGEGLKWELVIDGLLSSEVSTTYRLPSIASFSGPGAVAARSEGNQVVYLNGTDFGPDLAYITANLGQNTSYLEWVRYTPFDSLSADGYYEARDCVVASHELITCTTVPGTGLEFSWFVRVRGQTSLASLRKWSYAVPQILRLEGGTLFSGPPGMEVTNHLPNSQNGLQPRMFTNDDGEHVRLVGRGFGVADPLTSISVRVGTKTVAPINQWADTATGLEYVEIIKPAGHGASQTVQVVMENLEATARSSNAFPWHYARPRRISQPRDENAKEDISIYNITVTGTSFCRPATGPGPKVPASVAAPLPIPASVTSPQDNCGQVYLQDIQYGGALLNPALTIPAMYPNWVRTVNGSSLVPVPAERFYEWNDTYIKFWVYSASGLANIQIGDQVAQISFSSTTLSARKGTCGFVERNYQFDTAGGQILTMPVAGACEQSNVKVLFARRGSTTNSQCIVQGLPSVRVQPDEIGDWGTTADADVEDEACLVRCSVPPGDGGADFNSFTVDNGDSTTPQCPVRYAPPNVTSVSSAKNADGTDGTLRTISVPMTNQPLPSGRIEVDSIGMQNITVVPGQRIFFTMPTSGGLMYLHGFNFGLTGPAVNFACSDSWVSVWDYTYPAGAPRRSVCAGLSAADAAVSTHSHLRSPVTLPAGVGSTHYLAVGVTALPMTTSFVSFAYARPTVVTTVPSVVPSTGTRITVRGTNFGASASDVTVFVGGIGQRECSGVIMVVPHTELTCLVPELIPGFATASGNLLVVQVADQYSCIPGETSTSCSVTISYANPVITSVSTDSNPVTAGDNVLVSIHGRNFGRNTFLPPSTSGAFNPATSSPSSAQVLAVIVLGRTQNTDLSYIVPDPFVGFDDRFDRGGRVVFHNHTFIQFISPKGQGGDRTLRLYIGDNSVVAPQVYGFQPPFLQEAFPTSGPTKGYIVRLHGSSFGSREFITADVATLDTQSSYAYGRFVSNEALFVKAPGADGTVSNGMDASLTQTIVGPGGQPVVGQLPCLDLLGAWDLPAIRDRWQSTYLHYENQFDVDPTPATRPAIAQQYTSTDYYCFVQSGQGKDVAVALDVDSRSDAGGLTLDYNPPYISSTQANPADAAGQDDFKIKGSDFGPINNVTNRVAVFIGEDRCLGAEQTSDSTVQCAMLGGRVGPKAIKLTAAGYTNFTYPSVSSGSSSRVLADVLNGVRVALDTLEKPLSPRAVVGHLSSIPAMGSTLQVSENAQGHVHIHVLQKTAGGRTQRRHLSEIQYSVVPHSSHRAAVLPRSAQAANGTGNSSDPSGDGTIVRIPSYTVSDYPVNRLDGVFKIQFHCQIGAYGQVAEECFPCPQGGYCEPKCLSATTSGICVDFQEPYSEPGWFGVATSVGSSDCDRAERPAPYDERACLNFLPCEPQEACIGNNLCKAGYEGERCGQCSTGFFRVAGLCQPCPDLAGLFIALFVIMIIGIAVAGYVLNRKKMHLAFISIGVDYFQVLAMFATARVQWPQFLRDLYRLLSIFQINIDITAPECAIPNVKYASKWFVIETLPLFLGLLLVCIHGIKWGVNYAMKVDSKHRNKHAPTLIATGLLLMYYLYLLLTKTTFDAFNCQPTEPSDGKLYLEVEFIECYQPQHNTIFYPALFFSLPVYTVAYPVWVYWHLKRNKDKVKTDQILRAMGIGDSPLTNPNYPFRQMFHKLYYHFKPGKWYWLLIILFRKFCIALTGLMFRRTPSFQMAMAFVILFFSFTMQVRHNPYMSMSERRGIILHHKSKAKEGNKKHQAIAAAYQAALRNSNARQRRRQVNMESVSAAKSTLGQDYLFDYNTMEAVLLSCGCFVCLSGIMFQTGDPNSDIYSAQRDALTVLVGFVIITSMVYFFTVFGFEVYSTFGGGNCDCGKGRSATEAKRSNTMGGKGKGRKDLKRAQDIDAEMAATGGMELNPMAMRATMASDMAALADILGADGQPTQEQWNLVRVHANTLNRDVTDLRWEVSSLQDKQEEVVERKKTLIGRNGKRRSILDRALGLNMQSAGATPDVAGVIAARSELSALAEEGDSDEAGDEEGVQMSILGAGESKAAPGGVLDVAHAGQYSSLAEMGQAQGATTGPWTRCHDDDGLVWYHNSDTGESSYDMPAKFAAEGSLLWTEEFAEVQAANLGRVTPAQQEEDDEDEEESQGAAVAGNGAVAPNPLLQQGSDRTDRAKRMSVLGVVNPLNRL